MKLDRNENPQGRGKYAIIPLRHLDNFEKGPFANLPPKIDEAFQTLQAAGLLDWGVSGTDKEFFVIRLKDKYAQAALLAYAKAAEMDGEWEFGREVGELAGRAGPASPWCKRPD